MDGKFGPDQMIQKRVIVESWIVRSVGCVNAKEKEKEKEGRGEVPRGASTTVNPVTSPGLVGLSQMLRRPREYQGDTPNHPTAPRIDPFSMFKAGLLTHSEMTSLKFGMYLGKLGSHFIVHPKMLEHRMGSIGPYLDMLGILDGVNAVDEETNMVWK
ncbi:hypothetical protein BDZ94DRAFT_1302102 [Collybia nuda]|uniref:Uncharacterized protein n=1 Tax=Collybia nuda TaxID=64659 RepID=A0A9P5XUP5_9AGAR|nr:hypothetical protein BDZ94DRAFT_1302102 [Collybia nuda]